MIGLVTMAAHYDWNIFIVLSGTIDNLRKQTRDRFFSDLTQSGGVSWHILDYTRNADYLIDVNDGKHYLADDLALNIYQEGAQHNNWMHRYVIVCLKNSTRLKNLIATVYKGNIIKNLIMDCQSYTKYRPNETTGGIFVSWRRKEELPTGA